MTILRRCKKCGVEFPPTSEFFHRDKSTQDGLTASCKSCRNAHGKEYASHPENQEKMRARRQEYYRRPEVQAHERAYRKDYCSRPEVQAHREVYRKSYRSQPEVQAHERAYRKTYGKDYHIHNRERILAQKREYQKRPEVQEHVKKYMKGYRQRPEVQERDKKRNHRYYESHQGKSNCFARVRNRRAKQRSVLGHHTASQIQEQLKRQHYLCYYCSTKFKKIKGKYSYHVDHTFPLSRVAGTDIPANDISYLVLSCEYCNKSKRDRFPWEWPEGGRLL